MAEVIDRPQPGPVPRTWLAEVVPPRANDKTPAAVEALLQALALDARQRFSLELAGEPDRVRVLVRLASAEMHAHLLGQLRQTYPQAEVLELDAAQDPADRPAASALAQVELALRAGPHLPLKGWDHRDWADGSGDALLGILAALSDCPPGERALCQLVLAPARPDWSRGLERLALENPVLAEGRLEAERARARGGSAGGAVPLAALLAVGAGGLQVRTWLDQGEVLPLALAGAGLALGLPLVALLGARLRRPRPAYDPKLVAEKVSRVGYLAHPRLTAFAPTEAGARARLARLVAAYQQVSLATGNGLVARPWAGAPRDLAPGRRPPWRRLPILTVRELATLWHLPRGADEVPLLRRAVARHLLPAPTPTAGPPDGCPIGVSEHHGRQVGVALPRAALARNLVLVAKTGKGKSTLMEHLAAWEAAQRRSCVVVVDPHGDMARALLAALPLAGVRDPIWVDFANLDWPVGLNLLDVHLGRDRDKAVSNVIDIFSRIWDRFWGARMEDCLRFCLLALYEINTRLPPERQYTVLHVKRLLLDPHFRRTLLPLVDDREVVEWWQRDFAQMPPTFAQEVAKPVLTKLNRFAGSVAARNIVGQPRTTLDLRQVVRERRVLLVNTATGLLGEGTAALLGATLLDLLDLTIMEQAALPPERRVPVRVFLDEFQAIPAVDHARLLGQLRKFGASFVLATQALARLDQVDRALRGTLFGNVETLVAFQVSAEDARYLAHELDGLVDETDLINLPDYHAYLKTVGPYGRQPTCLLQLAPPLAGDPVAAAEAARRSAGLYGRPVDQVDELLRAVGRQHHAWAQTAEAGQHEAMAGAAPQPPSSRRRQRGKTGRGGPPDQAARQERLW